MTYSLVARDPETGALGVGVQSHFFGVGRIVPWAEPGVGAVATQSFAEPGYGPRGLDLLRSGVSAEEALASLVVRDRYANVRQVGLIDADGRTAVHTGQRCVAEAGHARGSGAVAQANMMAADSVWGAMLQAFEDASLPFVERILHGLEAAENEGGDIRGKQSAALLVVRGNRSEEPWSATLVDVRVDDHPEPLRELRRLTALNRAYELLGRTLFTPGIVTGVFTADEATVDGFLADLAEAQEMLGANPEPTLWRGVLEARSGRLEDARRSFLAAARENPALAELVRRFPLAGLLPTDEDVLARIVPRMDEFGESKPSEHGSSPTREERE